MKLIRIFLIAIFISSLFFVMPIQTVYASTGPISISCSNPTQLGITGSSYNEGQGIENITSENNYYLIYIPSSASITIRMREAIRDRQHMRLLNTSCSSVVPGGDGVEETFMFIPQDREIIEGSFTPGPYVLEIISGGPSYTLKYSLTWSNLANNSSSALAWYLYPIEAYNDNRASDWYFSTWTIGEAIQISLNVSDPTSNFNIYVYSSADLSTPIANTYGLTYPKNVMFSVPSSTTFIKINRSSGYGGYRLEAKLAPKLSLSASTYSVNENQLSVTLRANLNRSWTQDVIFTYELGNGSAIGGNDFVDNSGYALIPAGQTYVNFSVPIINDSNVELEEYFYVNIKDPDYAVIGSPDQATITIVDNDKPSIFFDLSSYTFNESAGLVSVMVRLSSTAPYTVTARSFTQDGTAMAWNDYTPSTTPLTFNPGVAFLYISVPILEDSLDEAAENFSLRLDSIQNAVLGSPGTTTVNITDNDPTPSVSFALDSLTVLENAVSAALSVNLSSPSGQTVTVNYASSNGTATAGSDYTAVNSQLTFSPGDTTKSISIPIINDSSDENQESFNVTLGSPINAVLGSLPASIVYINDDDPMPTVHFSETNFSEYESSGSGAANVTLSSPSGKTVQVHLSTSAGSAQPGVDYTDISTTVTFNPGETHKFIGIPFIDDNQVETDETINLFLQQPVVNASLGNPSTAMLTILDDDLPLVYFDQSSCSVNENAGSVSLTVRLTAMNYQDVKVPYSTYDGSAIGNYDYTPNSSTLTIPSGQTSATISISIINDNAIEGSENFTVSLKTPTNAELGSPSTATVTIVDDDAAPTVYFSSATYLVNENGSSVPITVNLSRSSTQSVTVNYATNNISAISGSDYTAASSTLTFTAGQTSKTFNVPILDDTSIEGPETFGLTLSSPNGATLGSPSTTTVTIVDDDSLPTVYFSSASYSVNENGGSVSITANLSKSSPQTVTVNYASNNISATSGSDYTAASDILTFSTGQTSKSFSVTIINDTANEGNETFGLTLSSPNGATLGAPSTATVMIVDDDQQPLIKSFYLPIIKRDIQNPVIFSDDFSIDRGWTNLTNGRFYRNITDQDLYFDARRAEMPRFYIPINAPNDHLELDFSFKVSASSGNGNVYIGLVENMDAPQNIWGVDATGFFVGINRDYNLNAILSVVSQYQTLPFYGIDMYNSPLVYGSLNVWRKVTVKLDGAKFTIDLKDQSGQGMSQLSGSLPGLHNNYQYLMIFLDVPNGWESIKGYIDDIRLIKTQ